MRSFKTLLCLATILVLSATLPSDAQLVCNKMKEPYCNRRSRFRSLNGVCNNLKRPFLGAAETAFRRLLPPDYADGKSEPREGRSRPLGITFPLPNARNVSLALFKDVSARSQTLTHMAMVFGQFLAHDITLAGQPEEITCDGSCQPVNECFGIPANKTGDPAFPGADGINCIILRRNRPCEEDAVPREQVNILTSYIDASHIYGNNEQEANDVRDLTSNAGLLKTMPQNITALEDLLPPANPHTPCRTSDPKNRPCFLTGDFRRNNENQGLNTMHTIWVREHNRIALKLGQINPSWSGNKIFQETRRIVGAKMQHITYNEFLPSVLGDATMEFFNLTLLPRGRLTSYSPNINPSVPNSLATAALRFGHSTIRNQFRRFQKDLSQFPAIPTKEFLNPEFLYETEFGGLDSIIRGMAKDEANEVDGFFADAILKYHLGEGGQNGPSRGDLITLNIQRGREHGLPSYNEFRSRCGLGRARQFSDLRNSHTLKIVSSLQNVYKTVDDIDLFVGGILEIARDFGPQPPNVARRSRLGPTFGHIIASSFRDLRFGDRFWYETNQFPVRFTFRQLSELRKVSLARIICDNSDGIHEIQPWVLRLKAFGSNDITPCDALPSASLQEWKVQVDPILH